MTMPKFEPVALRYEDARGNYRYRGFVPNFMSEYSILKPISLHTADQLAEAYEAGKMEQAAQINHLQMALADTEALEAETSARCLKQATQIEMMREFIARAPVSSGVCCCGESMNGHSSPMSCGHSPVDLWDHSVEQILSTTPDQALEQRAAKVREERSGLKPPKGYSAEELEKDNPFNQWMRED